MRGERSSGLGGAITLYQAALPACCLPRLNKTARIKSG
jgi:hypothetical protein